MRLLGAICLRLSRWHHAGCFEKAFLHLKILFLLSEGNGQTLFDFGAVLMVHGLVDGDVHFLDQNGVSWDAITLLHVDDVANNKVLDPDRLCRSVRTSVHSNLLLVDFILEQEELSVFTMVADGCNDGLREQSEVNCQTLNIAI